VSRVGMVAEAAAAAAAARRSHTAAQRPSCPPPPPHAPCTAGSLLPTWLTDQDWRKRHATLICLAQIAEGCTKEMSGQIETLVRMCLAGLQDPQPKVGGVGAGAGAGGGGETTRIRPAAGRNMPAGGCTRLVAPCC